MVSPWMRMRDRGCWVSGMRLWLVLLGALHRVAVAMVLPLDPTYTGDLDLPPSHFSNILPPRWPPADGSFGPGFNFGYEDKIRLMDGGNRCEGRLEVYLNDEWTTVCDDEWDLADANVVCRQLDCGVARMPPRTRPFGNGTGPIKMSKLDCIGNETEITNCPRVQKDTYPCTHLEDVGIICKKIHAGGKDYGGIPTPWPTPAPGPFNGEIRLVNGNNSCQGRVEIYYNSNWGTVCDDDWTVKNAEVVCRQLNCGVSEGAYSNARFEQGGGPIHLDNVNCVGNESKLELCKHIGWDIHNCGHHEDASVICACPSNGPCGTDVTTAATTDPADLTTTATSAATITASTTTNPTTTASPPDPTTTTSTANPTTTASTANPTTTASTTNPTTTASTTNPTTTASTTNPTTTASTTNPTTTASTTNPTTTASTSNPTTTTSTANPTTTSSTANPTTTISTTNPTTTASITDPTSTVSTTNPTTTTSTTDPTTTVSSTNPTTTVSSTNPTTTASTTNPTTTASTTDPTTTTSTTDLTTTSSTTDPTTTSSTTNPTTTASTPDPTTTTSTTDPTTTASTTDPTTTSSTTDPTTTVSTTNSTTIASTTNQITTTSTTNPTTTASTTNPTTTASTTDPTTTASTVHPITSTTASPTTITSNPTTITSTTTTPTTTASTTATVVSTTTNPATTVSTTNPTTVASTTTKTTTATTPNPTTISSATPNPTTITSTTTNPTTTTSIAPNPTTPTTTHVSATTSAPTTTTSASTTAGDSGDGRDFAVTTTTATTITTTTTAAPTPTVNEIAPIRLVNGPNNCSGRVEIQYGGVWGTICDDYGWGYIPAMVVCRQLGCGVAQAATYGASFGQGEGFILMDNIICSGSEEGLSQCEFAGWGEHNCAHIEDAGVICEAPPSPEERSLVEPGKSVLKTVTTAPPSTPPPTASSHAQNLAVQGRLTSKQATTAQPTAPPPSKTLRLVGGNHSCEGRVEVYLSDTWGTVCDDAWDLLDAVVVCRQVGCGKAVEATQQSMFGAGTGRIQLDNLKCNGTETSLVHCSHITWDVHNCDHSEDAGVICLEL